MPAPKLRIVPITRMSLSQPYRSEDVSKLSERLSRAEADASKAAKDARTAEEKVTDLEDRVQTLEDSADADSSAGTDTGPSQP